MGGYLKFSYNIAGKHAIGAVDAIDGVCDFYSRTVVDGFLTRSNHVWRIGNPQIGFRNCKFRKAPRRIAGHTSEALTTSKMFLKTGITVNS